MTAENVKTLLSGISVVISLAAFALSYRLSLKVSTSAIKPILVFVYNGTVGWKLRNIGSGPALNVIVAQRKHDEWFNPVRVPPLSKDDELILRWLGHVNDTSLGAAYNDFQNRLYSTKCSNDLSEVFDTNTLPSWEESVVGRHWNHPMYEGA